MATPFARLNIPIATQEHFALILTTKTNDTQQLSALHGRSQQATVVLYN